MTPEIQHLQEELIRGLRRVQPLYQKLEIPLQSMGRQEWRSHNLQLIRIIIAHYERHYELDENQMKLAKRIINEINEKEKT